MTPVKDRVLDETTEIELKLDRLDEFLKNPATMDLVGEYHFDLLMAQRHAMNEYKKVLDMRFKDLDGKDV